MTVTEFLQQPARYSVALVGLGRANRAVLDWLLQHGGSATVYAEAPVPPDVREAYAARGIAFCVGEFPVAFPAQMIVRSPGVRPDIPAIQNAVAAGACLTSETELFMALAPCRVIGITGSDGKTTTANLTARLLQASGHRTWLGGNNGTPLLPQVGQMKKGDIVVLELSSFQLMTLKKPPAVAVVTNLTPNHLNWHIDMAEYAAAKCRIFAENTRLVLNAESPATREIGRARAAHNTLFFSSRAENAAFATDILRGSGAVYAREGAVSVLENGNERAFTCLDVFRLAGRHNLENLLAAMGATAPDLTAEAPRAALRDFCGVRHRLEYVDTVRGVKYYNSSIDTSPTRTAAALAALDTRPIVIAGGRGKGISFAPLALALRTHAKAVYLYGEAAGEIAAALDKALPYAVFARFVEAFAAAAGTAVAGDTVLLSPACTAFGEFRDFEERGEMFCRLVAALAAERK